GGQDREALGQYLGRARRVAAEEPGLPRLGQHLAAQLGRRLEHLGRQLLQALAGLAILLEADEGDGGTVLGRVAAACVAPGKRAVPRRRRIVPRLLHAARVVIGLDLRQVLREGGRRREEDGGEGGDEGSGAAAWAARGGWTTTSIASVNPVP